MSVLIKMDMPKSCDVCDFMRTNDDLMSTDYRYMYCGFPGMGNYVTYYTQCRLEKCPLLEVPAHERLIDADKLQEEMLLFIKENMLSRDDARELLETIADAPAIIPAEEGKT